MSKGMERLLRRLDEWSEQAVAEKAAGAAQVPAFGDDDDAIPRDDMDAWDDAQDDPEGAVQRNASSQDLWFRLRFGTVHDVAALFRANFKTIEEWRRRHGLPFFKQGGLIRYSLCDVLKWAAAKKQGA